MHFHVIAYICRCYVELLQKNTLEGILYTLWRDFSSICSFQWSSCEKFNWIIYLGTRYIYTCTLFINTHIALYSMKSNRRCYFLRSLVKKLEVEFSAYVLQFYMTVYENYSGFFLVGKIGQCDLADIFFSVHAKRLWMY